MCPCPEASYFWASPQKVDSLFTLPVRWSALAKQLVLDRREEALGDSVVPAVTLLAHTTNCTNFGAHCIPHVTLFGGKHLTFPMVQASPVVDGRPSPNEPAIAAADDLRSRKSSHSGSISWHLLTGGIYVAPARGLAIISLRLLQRSTSLRKEPTHVFPSPEESPALS